MNKEISLNEQEKNVLDFLIKNEASIKGLINKQKIQGFSLREEVKNLKDTKQTTERISKDYLKSLKAFADKNDCKKVDIMNMAILEFLEKYTGEPSDSFSAKKFILENTEVFGETIKFIKSFKNMNLTDLKNFFETWKKTYDSELVKTKFNLYFLIIGILLEENINFPENETHLTLFMANLIKDEKLIGILENFKK